MTGVVPWSSADRTRARWWYAQQAAAVAALDAMGLERVEVPRIHPRWPHRGWWKVPRLALPADGPLEGDLTQAMLLQRVVTTPGGAWSWLAIQTHDRVTPAAPDSSYPVLTFQSVGGGTQLLHLVPLAPVLALRALDGDGLHTCTLEAKALHQWTTLTARLTPEEVQRLETLGRLESRAPLGYLRALGAPGL